jgi:hypothetical protein
MFAPKIVEAEPLDNFIIWLKFADGISGKADLSHLSDKGVFSFWNEYENIKNARVIDGRYISWGDEIDIDADSLYIIVSGKTPEDLFPLLNEAIKYA